MSTDADRAQGPLIIIDKKTRSVEEVRSRIAQLQQDRSCVDAAYSAASSRRADVYNELEELTNALTAGGFPIHPHSP